MCEHGWTTPHTETVTAYRHEAYGRFPVGGSFQLDCVEAERRHGRRFGDIEWWVAGRPSPTMRREPCDDPTYGELFGPSSAGLICESCGFRQGEHDGED